MKPLYFYLIILLTLAAARLSFGLDSTDPAAGKDQAAQIVEQMRGFNMQGQPGVPSDGRLDPRRQRRQQIMKNLRERGEGVMPALAAALSDADVQMRRNATLAMIDLAGAYSANPRVKVDISGATTALIKATEDNDTDVRAWAAHALAELGPKAKEAVPALIKLVSDPQEGPRNTSCMALGAIGAPAKTALPALQAAAQNDPGKDVRRFAENAIKRIQDGDE